MTTPTADQGKEPEPVYEKGGARLGLAVVVATVLVSTAMGVLFYSRYSETLLYVKETLDDPDVVHAWDIDQLAPSACVDQAMDWASGCTGIKSMCDMYVDQVIADCMRSADRTEYCLAIADESPTRFGADDCRQRGVQKYVDSEACAKAYGALVAYCTDIVDRHLEGSAAAETARREAGPPL